MKPSFLLCMMLATGCMAVATDVRARPIPGPAGAAQTIDIYEESESPNGLVDPVVLEPIRPLFPSDRAAASTGARPEPCGAITPLMLGLTFAALGFVGGRRTGAPRLSPETS